MTDEVFESGFFLSGQQVYWVGFDFAFTLLTSGKANIKIEGDFWLSVQDAEPARVESSKYAPFAGSLVSLHFSLITSSKIEEGELKLSFDNGASIRVESDPDYEAWTIGGPGGLLLVSQAGGEVSYYPPLSANI